MHGDDSAEWPAPIPHDDEERSRGNRSLDDEPMSEFNRPRISALEEEED
jgi:hypothetical protein